MRVDKTFGEILKELREKNSLTLKEVSTELGIDNSTLGKLEKNKRFPNKDLINRISCFFNVDEKSLLINHLSDKVVYQLGGEEYASEILKVADAKVKYNKLKDSNAIN